MSKECVKKTTVPEMSLRRRNEALKENEENVEEEEEEGMEDLEDLEAMALQFLAGYYHIIYYVHMMYKYLWLINNTILEDTSKL